MRWRCSSDGGGELRLVAASPGEALRKFLGETRDGWIELEAVHGTGAMMVRYCVPLRHGGLYRSALVKLQRVG